MEFRVLYSSIRIIGKLTKTFVPMKTTILLTIIICVFSGTPCNSQTVTLSLNDVSIQKAFKEIKKQTGYSFVYTTEQIKKANPVSIHIKDASLNEALDICFTNQPLTFIIDKKYIIVKDRTIQTNSPPAEIGIDITGKVVNEDNDPVIGATVAVEGSNMAIATDSKGEFGFGNLKKNDVLQVTCIGYQSTDFPIQGRTYLEIRLPTSIAILDETVVKGYYTTTKRLNTGSVSKVTSEEIGRQPISDPLAALQGKVPGLLVTQASGLPGSNFSVLIRGQNSIQSGTAPLYIIDGVPFLNNTDVITQESGINADNPFNTIDPSDIESIEILKDADATAIYGSRGANGVILITTRKGRIGKPTLDINVYSGWGKIARTIQYMNTTQYLEMRHEAFRNDKATPTLSRAYDLLAWDTTRYTDLQKLLIGNTAHISNASVHLDGGNEFIKFSAGANYYHETTVFPGNHADNRISFDLSLDYKSLDKKLSLTISASYANDKSNLIRQDLTQFLNLPPNIPELYDSTGKLNWIENGFYFNNPLANTLRNYKVQTNRLTADMVLEYRLLNDLRFKANLGYNELFSNEFDQVPIASQNPHVNPTGSAFFGETRTGGWIIEPQIEYAKTFGNNSLQIQLGCTFQDNSSHRNSISASGYTNDYLLNSTAGAQTIYSQVSSEEYHYIAGFGHLNYTLAKKYLINLTGRRDGSSRFGPGRQFANFWAAGLGWIFSQEKFLKQSLLLSYGKLRGSYGIAGNDLIGNYQYLDLYAQTLYPYQDQPALFPVKLYNSDYSWERIKKLDIGVELGFIKDRLLLTADWFKDKSDNQIIYYSLPGQTGFSGVLKNFPGVVQNAGFEFSLNSSNIKKSNFNWSTQFNITWQKNKLLKFPGLESSSYADRYTTGKPLNAYIGAIFSGVNPQTGVYQFLDKDKNPTYSPSSGDYSYLGTTDPVFYGGFENQFNYKNWQFNFLFEFKKQKGIHPVYGFSSIVGSISNQPVQVLDRWQKPGDMAPYEQFTQTIGAARTANSYLSNSNAVLTNASYCRLKNTMLSYALADKLLSNAKIENLRLYIEGQNLLTLTNYKGLDPENQSLRSLPPLKRFVLGLQVTF